MAKTLEEMIAGNEIIAKFMGYLYMCKDCYSFSGGPITGKSEYLGTVFSKAKYLEKQSGELLPVFYVSSGYNYCRGEDIIIEPKYHTSWDLLMPVIEKIEAMHNENNVCFNVVLGIHSMVINPHASPEIIFSKCAGRKIDAAWLTIVEFAQWYNTQNK